ncbi:MAG: hypothetical protein ACREMO_03150 [Gemmatimonadales bacterium]
MPRVLTVSRVSVPADHEAEYLTAVRELAALAEKRGQRLWMFRSVEHPHTFLEFSESPSALSHRSRASRLPEELRLERRLQALATYAPGSWELWEEIPPETPRASGSWEPEAEGESEE